MPHISLAAEKVFVIGGLAISNAVITSWLVTLLLIISAFLLTRRLQLTPTRTQLIVETLIGGLYEFFKTITGKHVQQFFPLVASLFLFIITANWAGLLPGVGTIGFFRNEHAIVTSAEKETFIPLLRGATADLNTTLALALVAVIAIQYFGFINVGFHYSTRFFNFTNPIYFVLGLLELISELSKIISFAFRLFGNIFAGEVLLTVMAFLMPYIVPLPFLMMELFIGFIQALVFSMLTAVFLQVAVSHGEQQSSHTREGVTHA